MAVSNGKKVVWYWSQVNWWDQFAQELEATDLEEICHQILDLYNPPQLATLATPASQNGKSGPVKSSKSRPKVQADAASTRPKTPPPQPTRD